MKKFLFLFMVMMCNFMFSQQSKTYEIDGVNREILLFEPTKKIVKKPVVFVFHGHGGNAKFASKKMDFQNYYPEAIVVFMQGIPGRTSERVDPKGVMNGWQFYPNDLENRDVKFFDAVYNDLLKNYDIDPAKVFVIGHSNGSRFANVLWVERPNLITAICTVAAQGGMMISGAKPISVWMSMGRNDTTVPFDNQEKSIPVVKKNLGIDTSKGIVKGDKTFYSGSNNTELVVEIRNEGHEFPRYSIPEMVDFFKRQNKK